MGWMKLKASVIIQAAGSFIESKLRGHENY